MLNRQKCLLHMIECAARPVSHFELTKWAFLLAREMPSRGGPAFYEFLPYQYGPFSFCLYREAGALARDGYLVGSQSGWQLVEDVPRPTARLPQRVRRDAARVVERFAERSRADLRDYVYGNFPWFTVNSTVRRLATRPVGPPMVYTAGYRGWQVDGFLDMLMRAGIRRLVDVRNNPVARRYGFHKSSLARLCGKVSIDYLHYPQLGIPSAQRRNLTCRADHQALLAQYDREILPCEGDAIRSVAELTREMPTVLVCAEPDPQQCHRSRLAKAIARITALPVHHLGGQHETGL